MSTEPTALQVFEIGKRYKFPQLSTRDVEVVQTIECWIEFYEKEFIWHCEYRALWKDDEDPDTKVVGDVEKTHCWRYTIERCTITAVEFVYSNDNDLWMVKVYSSGVEQVINLAFGSRDKAERMYRYFCQYKGFVNY